MLFGFIPWGGSSGTCGSHYVISNTYILAIATAALCSTQIYLNIVGHQLAVTPFDGKCGDLIMPDISRERSSTRIGSARTASKEVLRPEKVEKKSSQQNDFGGVKARAFEPWSHPELPCFEPEDEWYDSEVQRSPSSEGFLMVKEVKTGGSTAAAIHLRIARNVARRIYPEKKFPLCKTRNDHTRAAKLKYGERRREDSFLWAVIREPTKRTISEFFHFEVSRNKVEPTDENFLSWLHEDETLDGYYVKDMAMRRLLAADDVVEFTNTEVLDAYDFIGITERMDESAVALQLLLNLTTADVLYLNAKSSGGFDDGRSKSGCTYIVPSFVSPGMKKFFEGEEWKNTTAKDRRLYDAANRSLDLTIERLGRTRFEKALSHFQSSMKQVKDRCLDTTPFPCSANGKKLGRVCMWADSGCGMKCLDEVSDELNLYTHFW